MFLSLTSTDDALLCYRRCRETHADFGAVTPGSARGGMGSEAGSFRNRNLSNPSFWRSGMAHPWTYGRTSFRKA